MAKKRNVAFPMMGRYNPVIKYLVEVGLDQNYIRQPEITRRTVELGTKYSPDTVCMPFKTTMGSLMEALEAGADTLIMIPGVCRLVYYGELQEQILKDLGYEFEYINFSEIYQAESKKEYLKVIKRFNPKANYGKFALTVKGAVKMIEYIDEIESFYYKNCGFEVEKGEYKKVLDQFMTELYQAEDNKSIDKAYTKAKQAFANIKLDKPSHPLKVGIVGEYYTIQDEFSNLELERKLAEMGVEVHRWMNVSNRNLHYSGEKNLNVAIKEFCKYEMGPTSTANIWCARDYAEKGFDGVIHVKSAGCTPEIDLMPVLQNISGKYKMPILYLTYDAQTSDVGLQTRIEAFYDMLQMRTVL